MEYLWNSGTDNFFRVILRDKTEKESRNSENVSGTDIFQTLKTHISTRL